MRGGACGPSQSARSSRGPLTARRPIRVRRPAVRRGACGQSRECVVAGGVVVQSGHPIRGRGCPELVKPILLTDIGVCMLQHPSGRASRVEIHGRGASGPLPLRTRWVSLGVVLGYLVGYGSSRAEARSTRGLGSRTRKIWDLILGDVPWGAGYRSSGTEARDTRRLGSRLRRIWDLIVLGDVPLGNGPLDNTSESSACLPAAAVLIESTRCI